MLKLNRQLARIRQRDGISIIEVLTSMAVATIGVFGIMVMIPFAVRQSQRGLDNDAANALGRNAVEEMQIQGYFIADSTNNLERIDGLAGVPAVIHFDPIGDSNGYVDEMIGDISIDRASGLNLQGNKLSASEARRLCRSSDDISHSDPDSDGSNANGDGIGPPRPIFDVDNSSGSPVNIKRQFAGRVSWSMFLVPEKAAGTDGSTAAVIHRLRTFTLVYRDRPLQLPSEYTAFMAAVGTTPATGNLYDLDDTVMTGYFPVVNQITLDYPATTTTNIGKDDWVMLMNLVPATGQDFQPAVAPYNAQVMFAKVTRVNGNVISVDGGPFYFHDSAGGATGTQLVHLENVVNVFERSIAIED